VSRIVMQMGFQIVLMISTIQIGHYHVDPYLPPNVRIRGHLPHWHGPGCMHALLPIDFLKDHILTCCYRLASPAGTSQPKSSARPSPSPASSSATRTPAASTRPTTSTPRLPGSSRSYLAPRLSWDCISRGTGRKEG
jgi:hypothetical protein